MVTFVLLPGASSDSWYWHLVTPELEDAGHDVVAVDLPVDEADCELTEYADAGIEGVDAGDQLFPADFQRRVVHERLGITADEIDAGHLHSLSRRRSSPIACWPTSRSFETHLPVEAGNRNDTRRRQSSETITTDDALAAGKARWLSSAKACPRPACISGGVRGGPAPTRDP